MSDVPPPAGTERRDDEAKAPPRHDTKEMPVTKGEMRRSFRINEMYTVVVAIATAGAALLGGYRLFIAEARAAGAEEAASVARRQDLIEAAHTELRLDVRALYQYQLTRQPQERLERELPARDAGP